MYTLLANELPRSVSLFLTASSVEAVLLHLNFDFYIVKTVLTAVGALIAVDQLCICFSLRVSIFQNKHRHLSITDKSTVKPLILKGF